MGRAKLNLELISKEKSRNTTFHKRKKGLKKKCYEFSTLCGVDTCMIIYGGTEPEIWPENSDEVRRIIRRYKEHSKEERGRRNVDLSEYLEDRRKKMVDEVGRLRQQNDESKYPSWDDGLNSFSDDQLRELVATLENKLQVVKSRIELMVKGKQICLEEVPNYKVSSSVYQRSLGLVDAMQHQPISYVQPLDQKLPMDYPFEQNHQFDPNPMEAPLTAMMNYTDSSQYSNLFNPPLKGSAQFYYNNSTYETLENMVFGTSSISPVPSYCYSSNMQSAVPCLPCSAMPSSSQMIHESQLNEFYGFQQQEAFQMKHKRERERY